VPINSVPRAAKGRMKVRKKKRIQNVRRKRLELDTANGARGSAQTRNGGQAGGVGSVLEDGGHDYKNSRRSRKNGGVLEQRALGGTSEAGREEND